MTQQIDSKCDLCERIADWRVRDDIGNIYAAACAEHKAQRREEFYSKPTSTKN